MLCSNIVVIILLFCLIMLHFYTKNASAICQRTYIIVWDKHEKSKTLVHSILISAGVSTLSTFKMLADSCWACSNSMSVLSGPSDNIIQVDELDAIGIHVVIKLCSRDTQLDHTNFSGKSHIILALCHAFEAADYAQNYAGIIFSSLLLIINAISKCHYNCTTIPQKPVFIYQFKETETTTIA